MSEDNEPTPSPSPYDINPVLGLHTQRHRFTKTHMAQQCDRLTAGLEEAIRVTREQAPIRTQGYLQRERLSAGSPQLLEARWERGMYQQWSGRSVTAVIGAWHRILTYQENLPASRQDQGWGEVDLLAISHLGTPIIIELKATDPGCIGDPPAAALTQAVTYAIALQKAWPLFREVWAKQLDLRYGMSIDVNRELICLPVVIAAPACYWEEWIGETPRARTVPAGFWPAMSRLTGALAMSGFPATFVSLENDGWDADGLPIGIRATVLPPLGL